MSKKAAVSVTYYRHDNFDRMKPRGLRSEVVGKLRLASAYRVAYRLYGSLRVWQHQYADDIDWRGSHKVDCEKDSQSGQHLWV